ncbi:hypothetical protein JXQ70_14565 [bacterium]|nr:hypothetical protein [bacterium]
MIKGFSLRALFVDRLQAEAIAIIMDGRGLALDNVVVERLWRSLKYEGVYLKDYETVDQAQLGHCSPFYLIQS